jgi:3-dehydroquinate dehydratase/shikimate dehydrogenase
MGVIGLPIAQSKSPALHNGALHAAGLDACYVPLLVHDLAEFLASPLFGSDDYTGKYFPITTFLPDCPYETDTFFSIVSGFSVTIPHKEKALALCAEVDPVAAKIGAVNTLVKLPNGLGYKGYNTDYVAAIGAIEAAMGGNDSKVRVAFPKSRRLFCRSW